MVRYVHGYTAKLGNAMVDFGTGPAPSADAIRARYALESHLGRRTQWMDQQHGIGVYRWSVGDEVPDRLPRADVVFVDGRGANVAQAPVACVVTADCVPVLIGSRKEPVWAAVHAGRKGLEAGVLQQARAAFSRSDQEASDLCAWIGPSICSSCYEVDAELKQEWERFAPDFVHESDGSVTLDLAGYAEHLLRAAGIQDVRGCDICTFESEEWHSYRSHPRCGRQVGFIYADM